VLGTGEVIVDIVATAVTSYAGDVFSGARNYMLEPRRCQRRSAPAHRAPPLTGGLHP